MRRESEGTEPRDNHTAPGRSARRGARKKRRARKRFGTRDKKSREELLRCGSRNRGSHEDRRDSGAQRDLRKGMDTDSEPREMRHARHHSSSRGRKPAKGWDGSSVDRSPWEEHHARWIRERRRGNARSTSGTSGTSGASDAEEEPRGRRHIRRSSGRRRECAAKRRREPSMESRRAWKAAGQPMVGREAQACE